MTLILRVLADSLKALQKHPKLFVPKIIIAALYGAGMLAFAQFSASLLSALSPTAIQGWQVLQTLLFNSALLLFYILVVMVLDVLFSASYSVMLEDFFKRKKISVLKALKLSLKKAPVTIPAVLAAVIAFTLALLPISLLAAIALLSNNVLLIAVSAIAAIALMLGFSIAFFNLYPVSMLEKKSFAGVLSRSVSIARKNSGIVSKLAVLNFLISGIGFALAFLAENLGFLALFALFRFVTALLATFSIILNPVYYLRFVKGKGV